MRKNLITYSSALLVSLGMLATHHANAGTPTCPTVNGVPASLPGVGISITILTTNGVGLTNRSVGGSTVGACTPLWAFTTLSYTAQDAQGNIGAGGSDGQVYISSAAPNTPFFVNDTPASGIPLIGPALPDCGNP